MGAMGEAGLEQKTNQQATLDQGIDTVSNFQSVTFTKYVRVILPLDGFVFWVRADLVSKTALLNAMRFNTVAFNAGPSAPIDPRPQLTVEGDLHYASQANEEEAGSITLNQVVFTAEEEVTDLNAVGSSIMYLATITTPDGSAVRFTFSARGYLQNNSNVWHYRGNAVYADMASQIIDSPLELNTRSLVVSNSLPLWLAMNNHVQPDYELFGNPTLILWPSFLVALNLPPPYAAVHIAPESTRALTTAPLLGPTASHQQLARDLVKITLYGLRNDAAQDFVDFVLEQSLLYDLLGIMNTPILRDEKRTQVELNAIAMKKTIEFEVSYLQNRVRDIARQLILSSIPTYYPQ